MVFKRSNSKKVAVRKNAGVPRSLYDNTFYMKVQKVVNIATNGSGVTYLYMFSRQDSAD